MLVTTMAILGLIVIVSLYDFLSTRSWQQVTASDRVEAVFENRNKRYGAYSLRKNYNFLVILITLSMGGAIAASYGVSKAFIKPGKEKKNEVKKMSMENFTEDMKKEEDKIEEPLEEKIPEQQKTLAFVPPKFVDKESKEEPTLQNEAKNENIDNKTQQGNELAKEEPKFEEKKEETKKEPEILDVVEEPAEFPGGQEALAKYLQKNIKYPDMALEMGIKGKVYLRFVVSETGNISNVKVTRGIKDCPECDTEALRVVKGMPDWKPGKNNGKAVNQWYNLPIRFEAQN